jgi:F-type H+-transporting ATPase subunit a
MKLSPDSTLLGHLGPFPVNATLGYTWLIMGLLTLASYWATRRLTPRPPHSRWQTLLEILVSGMRDQIRSASLLDPGNYLPFIGTLFLFIASCNLLAIVPGYLPPTASLSTTTALALCVFVAVPLYGIANQRLTGYLMQYLRPSVFMLPFNIIGELSRTLALAVRLYGNIMSGTVIAAILLSITPFLFPIVLQLFGLITGLIQAYIFAVLAMVYIGSASAARKTPD